MRVLIFTAAVLASAAAVPSGLLAGHGLLGHGVLGHSVAVAHHAPLAVAHAAPYAVAHGPALPTISPGDIQGAAIDAHVDASDHARAAVDAAREYHDQAAEFQGRAINAAEDHSWQAVDAVKTAEAQLDGQAAGVAPVLAKQLAGHVAPVVSHAAYAAPVVGHAAYAAPVVSHAAYAAPVVGHAAYAAPALASSKTVVTQSLSQSHPAPVHSVVAPVAYGHGLAHGYAAHGVAAHGLTAHGYAAHGYAAHGLSHGW